MMLSSTSSQLCRAAGQTTASRRARLLLLHRRAGALRLQTPDVAVTDEPQQQHIKPSSRLRQSTPPSTPEATDHTSTSVPRSTEAAQAPPQAASRKTLPPHAVPQRLLPLLGAALVLGAACAVMPLPGVLACVLLLSAVSLMETFWRRLLPGCLARMVSAQAGQHNADAAREAAVVQVLAAAGDPSLQQLPRHPAEVVAWLRTAEQGLWGALWQPLLDFREDWQEAMSANGPYAWAYDASGISIGQLAPTFTGVQVLADPSTGAVAAVEADVSFNSRAVQDSVALQVLARGPLGRYSFSLEAARVTGRVRLVPVPQQGLLLAQYLATPDVDVALSTAFPALLPHNRAKLGQVEEIEDMLQETLQGVLGSPDVLRLDYQPKWPARAQYAAESAARAAVAWVNSSRSRLRAAIEQHLASWPAAAAAAADGASGSPAVTAGSESRADGSAFTTASSSSSTAGCAVTSSSSSAPGSKHEPNAPAASHSNQTLEQSAALALAAQKAAWQQQQQPDSFSSNDSSSRRVVLADSSTAVGGEDRRDTDSSSSSGGNRWHLSSSFSEAAECWTAAGITARLFAAATDAAGAHSSSSSGRSQPKRAAAATAAAAVVDAQLRSGSLVLNPVCGLPHQIGAASAGRRDANRPAAGRQASRAVGPGRGAAGAAAGSGSSGGGAPTFAVVSSAMPSSSSSSSGSAGSLGCAEVMGSLGASCLLVVHKPGAAATISKSVSVASGSAAASRSTNSGAERSGSRGKDKGANAGGRSGSSSSSSSRGSTLGAKQPQVAAAASGAVLRAAFCEPAGGAGSMAAGGGSAAGAGAAAMALPTGSARWSLLPLVASVSCVLLGSGLVWYLH